MPGRFGDLCYQTATVAQAEMYGDLVFHEVKDEMTGENNVWLWQ